MFNTMSEWLRQGTDIALATIAAHTGSAPRGTGARMAVTESQAVGTIGGGALEYKVLGAARSALVRKKSQVLDFDLSPSASAELGMVCGGHVTVYVQYIPASDEFARELFAQAAALFSQNTDRWLLTEIGDGCWRMRICDAREMKSLAPQDSCFIAPLTRAGRVYIFGGGHVSQELVPLLSRLEFYCVVFDELEQFSSRELFPTANRLVTGDFNDVSALGITEHDYVVIMTRGHLSDLAVQSQIMRLRPRYIGVIGSRAKIARATEKLLAEGITQEELACVKSPIGLDIKAKTPAEIAISIAAQLILFRHGGA